MKFARYLEDTQTPEWKRAYIDYRKLKRCIRAIFDAQLEDAKTGGSARLGPNPSVGPPRDVASRPRTPSTFLDTNPRSPISTYSFTSSGPSRDAWPRPAPAYSPSEKPLPLTGISFSRDLELTSPVGLPPPAQDLTDRRMSSRHSWQTDSRHTFGMAPECTPDPETPIRKFFHRTSFGSEREPAPPIELPPPMQDSEDRRISTFSMESWTSRRNTFERRLSTQTGNHFRLFPPNTRHRAPSFTGTSIRRVYSLNGLYDALSPLEREFFYILDEELNKVENFYAKRSKELVGFSGILDDQLHELQAHRKIYDGVQDELTAASANWGFAPPIGKQFEDPLNEFARPRQQTGGTVSSLDPDQYQQNKRKLKKAIREQYHAIELLNNYRVLNLTGFRKALKKFEKVTQMPAQQPYMIEKVDNCAFSSDAEMLKMMSNVESLYALHFTNGDKKTARDGLRRTTQRHTQHTRSFRSGLYIGLGITALSRALCLSFSEDTRKAIPAWAVLLQVYGGLLLPVVLALLVGANILVWKQHRINYVFIFEVDVRTTIDPLQYVEIPSILFLTLSYCALLSFSSFGNVPATAWPLVWLGFMICFLFNPLPVFARPSRYWLLKKLLNLLASGFVHVEFSNFWLSDQFCSLAFSFSSLWTLGCSVRNNWAADSYDKCGVSHHWQTPLVLSCVPALMRLLQCVKRYVDSGLRIHMINAGKYLSSVVYYVLYYLWRHHGASVGGISFILFCVGGLIMSVYSSAWDLLIDWSLLDPTAEYRFLRPELIYRGNILGYYFAIVSNVLIRFTWICYFLMPSGLDIAPRTFIVACLEILRRAHWNIYRLENEQVGNMDQYRVTREVPLPYTFQEGEDDVRASTASEKSLLGRLGNSKLLTMRIPRKNTGRIYGFSLDKFV